MSVKHSRESRLVEALIAYDESVEGLELAKAGSVPLDEFESDPTYVAKLTQLRQVEQKLLSLLKGRRPAVWRDRVYLPRSDGRDVDRIDVQLLF